MTGVAAVLKHIEERLADARKHEKRWGHAPRDKKIFLSDEGWDLIASILRAAPVVARRLTPDESAAMHRALMNSVARVEPAPTPPQVARATSDEVEELEKRLTAGAHQCAHGLCEAEILRNIARDAITLARSLSQPAPTSRLPEGQAEAAAKSYYKNSHHVGDARLAREHAYAMGYTHGFYATPARAAQTSRTICSTRSANQPAPTSAPAGADVLGADYVGLTLLDEALEARNDLLDHRMYDEPFRKELIDLFGRLFFECRRLRLKATPPPPAGSQEESPEDAGLVRELRNPPTSVRCPECHGTGRADNHVTGEVECSHCEGSGATPPPPSGSREAAPDDAGLVERLDRAAESESIHSHATASRNADLLREAASRIAALTGKEVGRD